MESQNSDLVQFQLQALKQRSLSLKEINDLIDTVHAQNKEQNTKMVIKQTPSVPVLPDLTALHFDDTLMAIQQYIHSFEYNFTNLQLSTYKKKKTFASMVDYAKILIKKSLPIRCLDGFILAAYLTCDIHKYCIRFPLRFMSKCKNKLYWHIVLGITHTRNNTFGAIGISRKNDQLSFKRCEYDSLLSLIKHFVECYQMYGHEVKVITIGVPLTNNIHSEDPIFWDILEIHNKKEKNDVKTHSNTLHQVFQNFIKQKDAIIRSLAGDTKPYKFHKGVVFDAENNKYYLKQQYPLRLQKVKSVSKDETNTNNTPHQEDINRV
eukprot:39127_1